MRTPLPPFAPGRFVVSAAAPADYAWLSQRSGCVLTTDFRAIIAKDNRGQTVGMAGYDSWAPNSVQMHIAVQTPIAWRSLLRPSLEYPFVQCGVGICLGIIPAHKKQSLRFSRAVGFEEVYRVKDGWAVGVDLVAMELRRADCRFIFENERRVA